MNIDWGEDEPKKTATASSVVKRHEKIGQFYPDQTISVSYFLSQFGTTILLCGIMMQEVATDMRRRRQRPQAEIASTKIKTLVRSLNTYGLELAKGIVRRVSVLEFMRFSAEDVKTFQSLPVLFTDTFAAIIRHLSSYKVGAGLGYDAKYIDELFGESRISDFQHERNAREFKRLRNIERKSPDRYFHTEETTEELVELLNKLRKAVDKIDDSFQKLLGTGPFLFHKASFEILKGVTLFTIFSYGDLGTDSYNNLSMASGNLALLGTAVDARLRTEPPVPFEPDL